MGNTANVQIRVSQTANAAPKSLQFVDYLQIAVQGGDATHDFFAGDFSALQDLSQTIAQNPNAWVAVTPGTDAGFDFLNKDLPAHYIKGQKGTMVVQFHPSEAVFAEDTPDYKQAGIATSYLVTDKGVVDVIVSYIEKLGPPVAGLALTPAITTVLGAVKTFLQSFITRAFNAASEGATEAATVGEEAAEGAAEEAAVEGEVIADELALSVSFGPLAIVGIVVAAITLLVSAILFFLAKTMTCFVRVYNFTDQQITLNICHRYELEVQQAPTTGVMPPTGVPPAPPGVKALDQVIYRADYVFLNQNDLKGVGAVINAAGNTTPSDPAGFPGLTFLFDVPAIGDNSIYVTLDGSLDCQNVWDNMSGAFKKLSKSACHGEYRAYMATNQLSGKSPSPITQENGYYYEFLVVLEKDGFFFNKTQ